MNKYNANISIIDDNITFTKVFDILLKYNGYKNITIFNNCSDFVKAFENKFNCDFIFLDINIPIFSGYDLLKYLIENNKIQNLKIIIISGNYPDDIKNIFEKKKIEYQKYSIKFLTKPILKKDLLELLDN